MSSTNFHSMMQFFIEMFKNHVIKDTHKRIIHDEEVIQKLSYRNHWYFEENNIFIHTA